MLKKKEEKYIRALWMGTQNYTVMDNSWAITVSNSLFCLEEAACILTHASNVEAATGNNGTYLVGAITYHFA